MPPTGRVDAEAYREALARLPRGSVAVLMAANHETGVLQPLEEVALAAHGLGATLHVDAVQALGKLPPETWRFAASAPQLGHTRSGAALIGCSASQACEHAVQMYS